MNIFKNFFKIDLTKSLKKKLPIEYKIKAPNEIAVTEIIVPNHLPNNMPEKIKIGEPNPKSVTQIIEKIKK